MYTFTSSPPYLLAFSGATGIALPLEAHHFSGSVWQAEFVYVLQDSLLIAVKEQEPQSYNQEKLNSANKRMSLGMDH